MRKTRKDYAMEWRRIEWKLRAVKRKDMSIYTDINIETSAKSFLFSKSPYFTLEDFQEYLSEALSKVEELNDCDRLIYECMD